MATNYPTSLDTATQQPSPGSTTALAASGYEHDVVHTNHSGALIQLETKLGIGASAASGASDGHVMTRQADGSTAWEAIPAQTPTAITVADGNVTMADDLTVTGAISAGSVVAPLAINAQTGTTYTFADGDQSKLVTASNGSAQTYTVPPNSAVAFAVGTAITIIGIGDVKVTLAQGSGVTINSKDSEKAIDGQHASVTIIKTATDTWQLIGALQA